MTSFRFKMKKRIDRNKSCPYLRQEAMKKTVNQIGAKNERIATISSLTTQDNKLGI